MDADGIRDVAAMYASPVDVRRKDLHINCPFGQFHSRGVDSSQGLSVKIAPGRRSVAFCFSCKAQGTLLYVFSTAAELDPTLKPVAEFILQRDGASLSGALARLGDRTIMQETPASDWASYAARCARQVPAYLVNRGITQVDVRRWLLGFDDFMQRAIFPVRDERKHVVGCLRRSVHEGQEPRYLDTSGAAVWKKSVFYGEDRVDRTAGVAHLIEGPMGTIFASRLLPNTFGIMGANTGMGVERISKLQRWGVRVVILMLDSDDAGRAAVYGQNTPKGEWIPGLKEKLRHQFVVKVTELPPGEDPDDVVLRDPTLLKRLVEASRYLETPTHLTGRPPSATKSSAQCRAKSIKQYLQNRHSK